MEPDQSPVGLMSYIIVPALPKEALVEWHVVTLENQIQCQCKLKTLNRLLSSCLKIKLSITLASCVKKSTIEHHIMTVLIVDNKLSSP